jgi:hypothetical protein
MNAYCRLTGKCSYANLRTSRLSLHGQRPVRLHKSFAFLPEFQLNWQQTSDAPHVGLVCPYNSEAGGSGYEVLKYRMMTMSKYNIGLLQIHLSSKAILTHPGDAVKQFSSCSAISLNYFRHIPPIPPRSGCAWEESLSPSARWELYHPLRTLHVGARPPLAKDGCQE